MAADPTDCVYFVPLQKGAPSLLKIGHVGAVITSFPSPTMFATGEARVALELLRAGNCSAKVASAGEEYVRAHRRRKVDLQVCAAARCPGLNLAIRAVET